MYGTFTRDFIRFDQTLKVINSLKRLSKQVITAYKRSFGQGSVFTPVCLFTQGRGSAQPPPPVSDPPPPPVCRSPFPAGCRPHPLYRYRNTVNEPAVRILVECILVNHFK